MPDNPLQPSFWDDEENRLWESIVGVFVEAMMDGIQGGIDALPPDIALLIDFDVVNQAAIDYARQYRYDWISKINDTTRRQVQTLIGDWVQSGQPLPSLEAQLAPIFGGVRAQMIASTEVTRIFASANQDVWRSSGMVSIMTYRTSKDDSVCPICSPLEGVEMPLRDQRQPPRHVRCRCWLTPVLDVEAVLRQAERFLNG